MKIASLISSATEILYALGLADSLVAVSHECDYPAAALSKPRVTRSHVDSAATSNEIDQQVKTLTQNSLAMYEIDVDRLADLKPDLIITQAQCDVCAVRYQDVVDAVAQRPELRETKVIALNPQSLADVLADIERIGQATDRVDEAQQFRDRLQARINAIHKQTATLSRDQRLKVACIEWIEPLMLSGNWMPEIVELAGGRHELTEVGRHSPYVSWQDLVKYDPELIVVMPCGFDLPRTLQELPTLVNQPDWRQLAAIRAKRVYAVDGNAYFNRSGPRLVDSLEILSHLAHPNLIDPPVQIDSAQTWRQIG
jgi:iron complex transport system substrate-binding protein